MMSMRRLSSQCSMKDRMKAMQMFREMRKAFMKSNKMKRLEN